MKEYLFLLIIIVLIFYFYTKENYIEADLRKSGMSLDEIAKQMGRLRNNEVRFYDIQREFVKSQPVGSVPGFVPISTLYTEIAPPPKKEEAANKENYNNGKGGNYGSFYYKN